MRLRLVVAVFVAVMLTVSRTSAQDFCFNAAVIYATGNWPRSVFVADLDGDNDADLAVANVSNSNVSVLINCDPCLCPCHGDPQCDGTPNVQDVVQTVNVAFRGVAPLFDPNCPRQRTDVNCDGVTTVHDVVRMVNVAFRGEDPATEFCDPCAP